MGKLFDRALDLDNLAEAWDEVAKNRGMPGVDNVSIERWRRNWEERLVILRQSVRSRRYKPSRLRLRRVPKRNRGQWRVLRIPTVSDRVLQRAVLQVLLPIFEPHFLDCSFGYRPGRSIRDAVQCIIDLRQQGFCWLLDADIDAFFDSVNHALLMRILESFIPDEAELFDLISAWLKVSSPGSKGGAGIAMGSPLSPLLANAFLHPFDVNLVERGYKLVRYADDFVVLCGSQQEAAQIYTEVDVLLADLLLKYKNEKTAITSFEEGFDFLGVRFYNDTYSFVYQDKVIESDDSAVNWLFAGYFPQYE